MHLSIGARANWIFYMSRLMWIIRHPNIMRMLNIFYMMVLSIRYLEKSWMGQLKIMVIHCSWSIIWLILHYMYSRQRLPRISAISLIHRMRCGFLNLESLRILFTEPARVGILLLLSICISIISWASISLCRQMFWALISTPKEPIMKVRANPINIR